MIYNIFVTINSLLDDELKYLVPRSFSGGTFELRTPIYILPEFISVIQYV